MTDEQKELVQTSFEKVRPVSDAAAVLFYDQLFARDPSLRGLFKIEACRTFSWKAAHCLDLHDAEGHAIGTMLKVLCSELMFNSIFKAMQAMGVNALDKKHPVECFMRESLVFPLYDAGNLGMQMRKIWGVMLDEEFDPRAFAASRPIKFTKSMEGV